MDRCRAAALRLEESAIVREIGYREIVPHMSEDGLERYAMRTLNEADLDRLDDHLLVCPECRERLGKTERYVLAMRAAAARSLTA